MIKKLIYLVQAFSVGFEPPFGDVLVASIQIVLFGAW